MILGILEIGFLIILYDLGNAGGGRAAPSAVMGCLRFLGTSFLQFCDMSSLRKQEFSLIFGHLGVFSKPFWVVH